MIYNLYATCPDELKDLLVEEIKSIGGKDIETAFRVVYFSADEEIYYRAHLELRLASRIYRILKTVPAHSPTIIFDKLKKIRFHEYFDAHLPLTINVMADVKTPPIEGHLIGSKIREAITDSFAHFKKESANLSSRDAKISVRGFYSKKKLMLSIDTSLESLHKRWMRVEGHPAPLKETLAASLLRMMNYDGSQAFFDPMCGSGTIVMEAMQMATNTPAAHFRPDDCFGFSYLNDFNQEFWNKLKKSVALSWPRASIFASDIDKEHLGFAKESAALVGFSEHIQFSQKDFFDAEKPTDSGILIANLPYGMRLDEHELDSLYMKRLGDHIKNHYKGWKCGFLMPENAPFKDVGLKPFVNKILRNGKIKVRFVGYEIY